MQNERASSQGIIDIIVPVIPESDVISIMTIIVVAIIILASLLYLWRMYMTPKGMAKRRLANLLHQNSSDMNNNKNSVYQLADVLKQGLGLTCLTQTTTSPVKTQRRDPSWNTFVQRLDSARYSANDLTHEALLRLMLDAKRWLK